MRIIRKLLLAGTSVIALAGASPALAADMAVRTPAPVYKAPAPAPAIFTWTGCYVGGHVGGAWGEKDFSDTPTTPPGFDAVFMGPGPNRDRTTGMLAGGQAGCDYKFGGNFVAGVEGQLSWADVHGEIQAPFFGGKAENAKARTDWYANATGRLGYAFDHLLIYGKGGGAWARDHYSMAHGSDFVADETRTGWTAGGGGEWAFTNFLSAKVEYQYYDFGGRDLTFTNPNNFHTTSHVDQKVHTVKFGVNFRFGPGSAPVSARY